MSDEPCPNLASTFLRLRADAAAEPLRVDEHFYQRLIGGELGSFHDEYLVSIHAFDADWPSWEMHPNGDEIVCLLSGRVTFLMQQDDGTRSTTLCKPGDFAIVPAATWHTAKVATASQVLFITPGEDTQHRDA
ncbi:cupin domain-containing protein [Thiosocius teredinicola]|uniref:cupin domain-containing protein n=1 Tax=Thiosocius teredinicola TaxID=1973002 RepID=UPI000F77A30B